ncbi:Protease 4 [Morus notabilis]|uniref:Protease 4 n=1 Tax=Morus notabilis TaxID=981085 RepID=W9R8X1_9ROSA|nr:Protease 4 [Morus notabilis]
MSKLLLLQSSHLTAPIHRRTFAAILSASNPLHIPSPFSRFHFRPQFSLSLRPDFTNDSLREPSRKFLVRAFDSSSSEGETKKTGDGPEKKEEKDGKDESGSDVRVGSQRVRKSDEEYPSGEFRFVKPGAWKSFVVKLRMLVAFPWERVRKGSVLTMKLRGQISDQLKSRFSSGLSLPQLCENFVKAAYDPRISGVYLHIDSLNCGWAKVEEIRRHILDFRKSGKFIVAFVPVCREKEYYLACACDEIYCPPSGYISLFGFTVQASFLRGVLDKVGIEPQVERIGKYKSAGDQLTRKTMSKENCEMLNALLDNIYGHWLDEVSSAKGKKREKVIDFIDEGVFHIERLKKDGWITDIKYDDELCSNLPALQVISMLQERLGLQKDKILPMVDYRKYCNVRKWTVGLVRGKDQIAVIRASGSISRTRSPLSVSGSGIIGEQLIEKIRSVRESKRYKAAIIRIDSPGGDALASDL